MEALGGNGAFWGWNLPDIRSKKKRFQSKSKSSDSTAEATGAGGYRLPLKQAVTAASLALTGDTIAQLSDRWRKQKQSLSGSSDTSKDIMSSVVSHHDWLRALRMTSYGFLFYGPGSYAWYKCLDHYLPHQTAQNLMLKIVLGPCVIAVVFAWNNLWLGKLSQLPNKYQKDALPTLFYGFRFWIPVSVLNFWVVPLQARVAFMSTGSIFWNFFLSSTMSK
ncbi:PREDICTED: protein Mpv17 isoform X3 [Theobroma cacao]|uniref:Protein Mpv17 isoform X3 n=2 Tax=Theobroma cacao TaxID=3641 RepID=A0AB32UW01_THECC|nr:PREDICTED: protein Mpv17 isoform X3 [Theobroma cacao]